MFEPSVRSGEMIRRLTSHLHCLSRYAFHDKDTLYLVMDLMEGGDLAFHLRQCKDGRFTEAQARFYGAEISLGLAHLHSHSFIYRDLKVGLTITAYVVHHESTRPRWEVAPQGLIHFRTHFMTLFRRCSPSLPTFF